MTHLLSTEAALNKVISRALQEDQQFALWLFMQTRFATEDALCVEVRANNPWGRVKIRVPIGEDGAIREIVRDAETDVLAVFRTKDGRRLALHIENKLQGGSFTPYQPETYRERLGQWRGRRRLGMYVDATSVLIAPQVFFDKNKDGAKFFEAYISHEALAEHLPAFRSGSAA